MFAQTTTILRSMNSLALGLLCAPYRGRVSIHSLTPGLCIVHCALPPALHNVSFDKRVSCQQPMKALALGIVVRDWVFFYTKEIALRIVY